MDYLEIALTFENRKSIEARQFGETGVKVSDRAGRVPPPKYVGDGVGEMLHLGTGPFQIELQQLQSLPADQQGCGHVDGDAGEDHTQQACDRRLSAVDQAPRADRERRAHDRRTHHAPYGAGGGNDHQDRDVHDGYRHVEAGDAVYGEDGARDQGRDDEQQRPFP
jgi:hypothetical protein